MEKISGFSSNKIIKILQRITLVYGRCWSMGHAQNLFDHGDSVDGGPPGSKNEDGDRFVEIWDLSYAYR